MRVVVLAKRGAKHICTKSGQRTPLTYLQFQFPTEERQMTNCVRRNGFIRLRNIKKEKKKHQATITFRTQTNNNDNNNSIKVAETLLSPKDIYSSVTGLCKSQLGQITHCQWRNGWGTKTKNQTTTTTTTTTTTITQLKQKQTNKTNRKLYAALWHSTLKGLVALLGDCSRFA